MEPYIVTCLDRILRRARIRKERGGMQPASRPSTRVGERETALAEADYYISLQPLPPRVKRTLFTIRVGLKNVIDLTGTELLPRLGITDDVLSGIDHLPCRTIGAAVNWLGHDGILVPSARRRGGTNLVIFQQDLATSIFEVTDEEVIAPAR